jgi:diguanylate cyclase (GGDEF)-like protein/PAS domain S-box-containing protein
MTDEKDFHAQLLDSLHDGVYVVDRNRVITYWNLGAEAISGHKRAAVMGRRCGDPDLLMHVDQNGRVLCGAGCPLAATMEDGAPREVEALLQHHDGHRVPVRIRAKPLLDAQGAVIGAVEVFDEDLQGQRDRERIAELERMALLDSLTELGNRRYAESQLHAKLGELDRFGRTFGVLFFDVDHFKQVNDRHGHEAGDRVLRAVARTARASVRSFDSLSRWGGDEFLGLVSYVDAEQLARVGAKICRLAASSRLGVRGDDLRVTLSMGAVLARPDESAEGLVARADRLMYASKAAGGNRVTVDPDSEDASLPRDASDRAAG